MLLVLGVVHTTVFDALWLPESILILLLAEHGAYDSVYFTATDGGEREFSNKRFRTRGVAKCRNRVPALGRKQSIVCVPPSAARPKKCNICDDDDEDKYDNYVDDVMMKRTMTMTIEGDTANDGDDNDR